MSIVQIGCLTLFAAGMALGQLLFKVAAERLGTIDAHNFTDHIHRVFRLALEPTFILAIFLYLSLSVFWTWILSFTPLSRAYPFSALAFVFTVSMGALLFSESVSRAQIVGLALILCGV